MPTTLPLADAGMAAQLAARSLGADAAEVAGLLTGPAAVAATHRRGRRRAEPSRPVPRPLCRGVTDLVPARPAVLARPPPRRKTTSSRFCDGSRSSARPRSIRIHPNKSTAVEKDLHQLPPPGQAALAQALMSMSSQSEPPRPTTRCWCNSRSGWRCALPWSATTAAM